MRSIVHCSASAFDAQIKGCRHKRRIASRSLNQRPLCNSGVKWSSLVGIHRSEQSCLLIGLPTARSHQLANTSCYCERNDAAQRTPPGVGRCAASIDLRTVATEFCSDGLYAILPKFSRSGIFCPGNGKFFWDPGKSSPVNIPTSHGSFSENTNVHRRLLRNTQQEVLRPVSFIWQSAMFDDFLHGGDVTQNSGQCRLHPKSQLVHLHDSCTLVLKLMSQLM